MAMSILGGVLHKLLRISQDFAGRHTIHKIHNTSPTIHSKPTFASKGKHGSEAITVPVEEVQEEAEIGGGMEGRDGRADTAWARTEARAG